MDDGEWYPIMVGHVEALKKQDVGMDDKIEAAKELAAMGKADSLNEQMSRQNSIVHAGGGEVLMKCLVDPSSEMLQWWSSLALTQLVFANERVIEELVNFSVVEKARKERERQVREQVEAALRPKSEAKKEEDAARPGTSESAEGEQAQKKEEHDAKQDDKDKDEDEKDEEDEEAEAEVAAAAEILRPEWRDCLVEQVAVVMRGERGYTTDKVKFGCLHILINIANKHWPCHKVMFHHQLVQTVLPILKAGNTPALVGAAVAYMCSLSYNHESKHTLVKTGVVSPMKSIARSEKQQVNAVSANIARMNLEGYAASKMCALGRGFLARLAAKRAARARKMQRLGNFFTNVVVWKCLTLWVRFRQDCIDYRDKTARAMNLLFNRSKHVGLRAFAGYTDMRHAKYEREERAATFRGKSVVARNLMFHMWVEFMVEHASWWEPEDSMEAEVKKKSSKFAALMSGQWVSMCFSEWRLLLQKKHKAMQRWANAATFLGWSLWVEYMYLEGPWWEPDDALQRQLDEKCGRVVSMLGGDFLRSCVREWARTAKKQKKAKARFLKQSLSHCFDEWFDSVFVDAAALYEQVALRCSKFLALMSGQYFTTAFKCWKDHASKMAKSKRFLQRISNAPAVQCWELWVEYMFREGSWWVPEPETLELLNQKCSRILAVINGDNLRSSLMAWHDLAHKNAVAMKRWQQQTEHWAIGLWQLLVADSRYFKTLQDKIKAKRLKWFKWENFVDWNFRVKQEGYARSLRTDAVHMWINVGLIKAFRSMDEFCQTSKHRRQVIGKFQMRWRMRPAQLSLLGIRDYVDQQMNLRWLMRRINNYRALQLLQEWREIVHETKIEQREQMAGSSPMLRRWMQRGMGKCFSLWRDRWETSKRNHKILDRMAYRIKHACVVSAFGNWNSFVDINITERYEDLKRAVKASLQGGTLETLLPALRRHHASFFRNNVRWNDFIRTYMQDAMAEISAEEAGEVHRLFNAQQLKRRRRLKGSERADKPRRGQYEDSEKLAPGRRDNAFSYSSPERAVLARRSDERLYGNEARRSRNASPPKAREGDRKSVV